MKKLISILAIFCFTFSFSQKTTAQIETKLNKLWNPKTANLIYGDENGATPEIKKSVIKFYTCMIKNYKINPKNFTEFMTNEEFKNAIKKGNFPEESETFNAEKLSFQWNAYGHLNYDARISIQKAYPKCIKKSDIDW